jgi:hypothetical protein
MSQRRTQSDRVVPVPDEAEAGHQRLSLGREQQQSSNLHSGVATKLSHMALLQASLTMPIDGLAPASGRPAERIGGFKRPSTGDLLFDEINWLGTSSAFAAIHIGAGPYRRFPALCSAVTVTSTLQAA